MNKTTLVMIAAVAGILCVIVFGFISSTPTPSEQLSEKVEKPLPSAVELEVKLSQEQSQIHAVLFTAVPQVQENYTLEREKLYLSGEWYGAILQYKGSDVNSRDTLRVVMQKRNEKWILRTVPPTILLNAIDLPDVPLSVLNDVNKPAMLAGTETSPTITPGE